MNCQKGHNGQCCCNCRNLQKVVCHPMNKTIGRGQMTQQLGYACTAVYEDRSNEGKIIFLESEHGMCELHWKK